MSELTRWAPPKAKPDLRRTTQSRVLISLAPPLPSGSAAGSGRIRLRSTAIGGPVVQGSSLFLRPAQSRKVELRQPARSRILTRFEALVFSAAGSGRVRLRSRAFGAEVQTIFFFLGQAQGERVSTEPKRLGSRLFLPEVAAVPSAAASGRIRLRATAVGQVQIAASGRIRLRSGAFGSTPPQSATGSGHLRLRSTVAGRVIATTVGRLRLRSRAIPIARIPGSGRVRLRSTAVGITFAARPGSGRLRLRSKAIGQVRATASGRLRLRSTAVARVRGVASGRVRLRSQARRAPLIPDGKPVADPQARDLALVGAAVSNPAQGEAFVTATSGDAILTPVDG